MLDDIVDYILNALNTGGNLTAKLGLTFLALALAFLVRRLAKFVIRRFTSKERMVSRLTEIVTGLVTLAAIVIVVLIWFKALDSLILLVLLGILVFVFAMQTLVVNLFAYFQILYRKPFDIGDRIEIDGIRGEVTHIGLLTFSVSEVKGWLGTQTPTGKFVHIPNSFVFEKVFSNESADFPYVWSDLTLPVTHASNLVKAENILLDAAKIQLDMLIAQAEDTDREKLEEQADLFESTIDPSVTMRVHGSGVDLTLRFLAPVKRVSAVETRLWKDVFSRIDAVDDIEYSPTVYRIIGSEPSSPVQ